MYLRFYVYRKTMYTKTRKFQTDLVYQTILIQIKLVLDHNSTRGYLEL